MPHNLLLRALSQTGITGPLLDWISDYLSKRSQKVVLDGTCSNAAQVTSGVPQGSILGPLLFNIFMNSISTLPLSTNSSLILYADDILLSKPINTDGDIRDLQRDVNLISTWMASNGLTPNLKKTQLLPISRARSPPIIRINLNHHPIAQCNSVKYLGVTISSDLSWKEHVTMTCKKAKQQLGLIHRSLHQSPASVKHQIYKAAILPKLEYCSSVWDTHHSSLVLALENVQKFAGRIITQHWKADYSTLCSTLNWKTLATRRKTQKLKICYNILNNYSITPVSLHPHPHPSPRHPHSRIIFTPYIKSTTHKSSFFCQHNPPLELTPFPHRPRPHPCFLQESNHQSLFNVIILSINFNVIHVSLFLFCPSCLTLFMFSFFSPIGLL